MAIVAIVGMDGCGKTTQAKMLVSNLREMGYDAEYVKPELLLLNLLDGTERRAVISGLSPRKAHIIGRVDESVGKSKMRRILLGMLGYLYAFTTYIVIASRSNRKKIVVCDRYFLQFFHDLYGKHAELAISMFPKPDVTFFLEGRLDLLHSRMRDPSDVATSKTYFAEVGKMFEIMSEKCSFIRVDARLDMDIISKELLQKVVDAHE